MSSETQRPDTEDMVMTLDRPRPAVDAGLLGKVAAVGGGAAIGASLVGGAVGAVVGLVALGAASPSDEWAELGAFIVGFLAGIVIASAVFIVAVIVFLRRLLPEGRRLRPAIAILAAPPVLLAASSLPSTAAGGGVLDVLAALLGFLSIAGAVVGLAALADILRLDLAAKAGLAIGAGLLAVGAATVALTVETDRENRLAELRAVGAPLVLADGESLDEPLPGWSLEYVMVSTYDQSVSASWDTPDGELRLRMTREPRACSFGQRCTAVGITDEGGTVWAVVAQGRASDQWHEAWVETAGGTLVVENLLLSSASVDDAVAVLDRLQPVSVEEFEAATRGY